MLAVLCYVCGYGIVCSSICVCGSIFVYYIRALLVCGCMRVLRVWPYIRCQHIHLDTIQGINSICEDYCWVFPLVIKVSVICNSLVILILLLICRVTKMVYLFIWFYCKILNLDTNPISIHIFVRPEVYDSNHLAIVRSAYDQTYHSSSIKNKGWHPFVIPQCILKNIFFVMH